MNMDIGIDFHGVAANPERITLQRIQEQYGVTLASDQLTSRKATAIFSKYSEVVVSIEEGLDLFAFEVNPYLKSVCSGFLKAGHGVFLISTLSDKAVKNAMKFLELHEVMYDAWISSQGVPKDEVMKSMGIDLIVDDDPLVVLTAIESGLDGLLFDRPCNRDITVPEGRRIFDLREIKRYIQSQHSPIL